ncbi:MAG: penicillin-binding protein 2 [Myxococcota bacterium]|jgi:penicillin-binding protein 2|nr:penicillin-binding protein 2 [Myxococcota bacterium]
MMGGLGDGRLSPGGPHAAEGRIGIIAVGIVVAFVIFAVRLFQLQIVEGADLRSRSEQNFVRTIRLEAPRGDIVDRDGRILATTRPAYRVQVIPNELRSGDTTFRALGQILDEAPQELATRVGKPRGRKRFQPVLLRGDLGYERFAQVESHRYALPGVVTHIGPRRDYAEGASAAHLLGTIGEIGTRQLALPRFSGYDAGEIVGQFGLEARLESHLRGKAGGRNMVVDVAGREIELLDEIKPVPGGRVVLTLDADLQRAAEEAFRSKDPEVSDHMGALVAIDPSNGEILALASLPAYDPNAFAGGIDSATWDGLISDPWKPLRNRAVSGEYPPGSTYKAVVAAAGLSEKEITREEEIFCPGHYRLGRRVYRCWKRGGHGNVNMDAALEGSCDVYFYDLGVRLGIDRIARYARGFGFGTFTKIDLAAEKRGLIPTMEWKRRAKGEEWIKGETVSAAIGQGYNLATPVQLAVAYGAIANGGRVMRPQLIKRFETWDKQVLSIESPEEIRRVPVSREILEVVTEGLVAVVQGEEGTGGRARIRDIEVAGKSGTTQVVSLDLVKDMEPEEIPIRYRDHALFAAFAPAEAPEIAVVALVEHAGAGGGTVAAPIVQKVMARYFEKQREREAGEAQPAPEGGAEEGVSPPPPPPPTSTVTASAPAPDDVTLAQREQP